MPAGHVARPHGVVAGAPGPGRDTVLGHRRAVS
jgi:hypothetical protein